MLRMLRRLALLTACAAALSVPALAHDRWRGDRDSVVVVVNGHRDYDDYGWRRGYWTYRPGWRGCDLPPGLAKKYGCYGRPVVVRPYYYYRPYYYRPRSGVSFFFSVR